MNNRTTLPSVTDMTGKERCLAAIHGRPVDRIPVFPLLMFLAADRLGISYRQYAGNGSAMAEAQVNVFHRFGLDAITACSDAFRVSADLGGEMAYPEDGTPHLLRPLVTCAADLDRLPRPDPTASGSRMADRTLGSPRNGQGRGRRVPGARLGGHAVCRGVFCLRRAAIHDADD